MMIVLRTPKTVLSIAALGWLLVLIAHISADIGERRITPALTHQQIADMIGTSRETVTRALKGLKHEGWLQQEGKKYLVPVD